MGAVYWERHNCNLHRRCCQLRISTVLTRFALLSSLFTACVSVATSTENTLQEQCPLNDIPNVSPALKPYTMFPLLVTSLFPKVPPAVNFVLRGQQVKPPSLEIQQALKWYSLKYHKLLQAECIKRSHFSHTLDDEQWFGQLEIDRYGRRYPDVLPFLRPHQKYGKLQDGGNFRRKDMLALNLRRLQEKHGDMKFNFFPESFVLPDDNQLLEKACNKSYKNQKWIVKPHHGHSGQGIKVVQSCADIPMGQRKVVQRYIDNPFLIDQTKNDLRLFVTVTCLNPLRVYLSRKGLVKLAAEKYSNDGNTLENSYVHLTNRAVNKDHKAFFNDVNLRSGHLWSLEPLWERIEARGGNPSQVWEDIKDLVTKTVISGETPFNKLLESLGTRRGAVHGYYGFDIILDDNLKPWLLEVNPRAGMYRHSEKVDGVIIKDMLNLAGFQIPVGNFGEEKRKSIDNLRKWNFDDITFDPRLQTQYLSNDEKEKHAYYCKHVNDSEIQSTILDILTPDDVRVLIETMDEYSRRGSNIMLFPSTSDEYMTFLEEPRYYNLLLHQWTKRYKNSEWQGVELLRALCQKSLHLQNPTKDPKHQWKRPILWSLPTDEVDSI